MTEPTGRAQQYFTTISSDRESFAFSFLAREMDPHRVRFWRVAINTERLVLQAEHEPDAMHTRAEVPWHELHDVLVVRPALLEEIEELKQEVAQLQHECGALRRHWHRLKRIVNAKQVDAGDATVIDLPAWVAGRTS